MSTPFFIYDKQPGELNFCFGLKVRWKNGETVDVYLGQGSTMSRNNWWMGSPAIDTRESPATIRVGEETFRLAGHNASVGAADDPGSAEAREEGAGKAGAQSGLLPPLIWLITVVGPKAAAELAKLIMANVNSFRTTRPRSEPLPARVQAWRFQGIGCGNQEAMTSVAQAVRRQGSSCHIIRSMMNRQFLYRVAQAMR